jgi:hypothetical protein
VCCVYTVQHQSPNSSGVHHGLASWVVTSISGSTEPLSLLCSLPLRITSLRLALLALPLTDEESPTPAPGPPGGAGDSACVVAAPLLALEPTWGDDRGALLALGMMPTGDFGGLAAEPAPIRFASTPPGEASGRLPLAPSTAPPRLAAIPSAQP